MPLTRGVGIPRLISSPIAMPSRSRSSTIPDGFGVGIEDLAVEQDNGALVSTFHPPRTWEW
jgi:hypothetical protein